ncbi:MAG: hypothetical protein A4E38_01139 [Methanoregulaceae archaeon PtaB.Bin108]|nr:MAG: hypothetical protein A4E38_01139 [Methanoregulaceae archaeon PtaB.Bin108]
MIPFSSKKPQNKLRMHPFSMTSRPNDRTGVRSEDLSIWIDHLKEIEYCRVNQGYALRDSLSAGFPEKSQEPWLLP